MAKVALLAAGVVQTALLMDRLAAHWHQDENSDKAPDTVWLAGDAQGYRSDD